MTSGILLGILLLGQMPTTNAVIGAAITLASVALVLISGVLTILQSLRKIQLRLQGAWWEGGFQ